jgi:putative membrane-bound dehydrogenase-like protein
MGLSGIRLWSIAPFLAFAALLCLPSLGRADEPRPTGPEAEKRFPPLRLPQGFRATLFACDPLIEYPSAIAQGPRTGSLYVAVDYMTGLGTQVERRDDIRLLEDTDGDGYADRSTLYATGFGSIQGLTFHDGAVYVMHAPKLTLLRDNDGDGRVAGGADEKSEGGADERRDLFTGLGLAPEVDTVRLHNANGLVMGYDGWLYLALGDHGCDVVRPEGDRLVLNGGGILRCRADGRDLHVFSTGLRNIYDVALDADLNVFVRDNENDGGDYKIRVCHSFFGADHGYPYLYYERPDEALAPLADLGLGSSAGGICYLERQFPEEYHGNLFFCEWGRAVVRYAPRTMVSGFSPVTQTDFAAGADDDPYGFKPTDLVVDRDGALFVSDWGDGQRPRRGRGRIYRITASEAADGNSPAEKPDDAQGKPKDRSLDELTAQLDSESFSQRIEAQSALEKRDSRQVLAALQDALKQRTLGPRARAHSVWIVARAGDRSAQDLLFDVAAEDVDSAVRIQAIRALADLGDPALAQHRLDAGPGDGEFAARLASLPDGKDPRILREVVVALARLRWHETPKWLQQHLPSEPDAALAHAAMQSLRRCGNWTAVADLLDLPSDRSAGGSTSSVRDRPIRAIALRAAADQFDADLVDEIVARVRRESDPTRLQQYADLLTRVWQKPGPWVYWGFRPGARPPGTVAWERTAKIEEALRGVLAKEDAAVRLAVLRRMQREKIPVPLAPLLTWLREERDAGTVAVILASLGEHPPESARAALAEAAADRRHAVSNRLAALALLSQKFDEDAQERLLHVAGGMEEGPVLAEALRHLAKGTSTAIASLFHAKLSSENAEVRTAAVDGLAKLKFADAGEAVLKLLADRDPRVRRSACLALGVLQPAAAGDALLALTNDPDGPVRRASFVALAQLEEKSALPLAVAALRDAECEASALECVVKLGGPENAEAVAELACRNVSADVLPRAVQALSTWSAAEGVSAPRRDKLNRLVAEVQGASGMLLRWRAAGPMDETAAARIVERLRSSSAATSDKALAAARTLLASGIDGRLPLSSEKGAAQTRVIVCWTELALPQDASRETPVQFSGGASGAWRIWLNGREVLRRDADAAFQLDSERFDATLPNGTTRIVVQTTLPAGSTTAPELQLRFRRKGSSDDLERLTRLLLARRGDAERGRRLFFDAEKSLCLKCHRLAERGERIGPDLTALGGRFSKIHVVESVLEPSRTIGPSFQTVQLLLSDGRVLSGIKLADADGALTLADNEGKKHVIKKTEIDQEQPQPTSTMPDNLVKRLTAEELSDVVEFLMGQKNPAGP